MKLEKTITSIFMVPTLNVPKNKLKQNGFINGYIDDVNKEDKNNNCVYLLFLPKDLSKFQTFLESEYERTKYIVEDYDYPKGYVVIIYKLNYKYQLDFDLVKLGKYSKTSKEFQELFPIKIDIVNENNQLISHESLQYKIFNKTDDLKEYWQELLNENIHNEFEFYETFENNRETLNINNIKKETNEK